MGLAGAGKDTTALILQRILGGSFVIDRYSAPLKQAAKRVFGDDFDNRDFKEVPVKVNQDRMIEATFDCLQALKFNEEENERASELFFDHLGFKTILSPREYQQLLGTEVVRAVRSSAWVDRIRKKSGNIIITDARFENEASDVNILVRRFGDVPRPHHPSELLAWELQFTGKQLPVSVFDLDNSVGTSLEQLEERIRAIVKMLNLKEVN